MKQRSDKIKNTRKEEWNKVKQKAVEELDDHLGISMMEPEKEIPKRDLPWWSEELHKAHLLVKYWKAKQFYTIGGKPFHDNLILRENELIDIDIH